MANFKMHHPYEAKTLKKLQQTQIEIMVDFVEFCEKHNLTCFALYGTAIGAVRHKGFIPWDDDLDMGMPRKDYQKFLELAAKELDDKYQIITPELVPNYSCTVTHLQLKGTRFVPVYAKEAGYPMCIDIDIFPFDFVADDLEQQKKQSTRCTILGRLLFLSGKQTPVIKFDGAKAKIMAAGCKIIQLLLRLFRVKPRTIYRAYLKHATAFYKQGGEYVTSFEYPMGLRDKIRYEEMFPITKVPFEDVEIPMLNNVDQLLRQAYGDYMEIPSLENQINHAPYLVQFAGEEPIYCGRTEI